MDGLLTGVAKVDITPPGPVPMAGYAARDGWSVGVHDALWARCFLFSQGEVRLALVVLDLLGVHHRWALEMQRRVADATTLPATGIVVACTHTHSAPAGLETPYIQTPMQKAVIETVLTRAEECAVQTEKSLFPGTISVATAALPGIAGHRTRPKLVVDQTLWALVIRDQMDRVRGVLANFPCHSTVLGPDNRLLSGDLFGTAAAIVERELGPNSVVAITVGAAGDISTRFFRQNQTFLELERLGGVLAEALMHLIERSVPGDASHIAIRWRRCWLPYKLLPTVKELHGIIEEGEAEFTKLRREMGVSPSVLRVVQTRLEGARHLMAMMESGTLDSGGIEVSLCGLRLGLGILIGIPGEPFSTVGEILRKQVTAPFYVSVLSLANGYTGYFPDEDAVREGWYEALISPFDHRATRLLIAAVEDLAAELTGAKHATECS